MAVRKRESKTPPAPQRQYATGQQQAAVDANDDVGFWGLMGNVAGLAVGATAGGLAGGPGGAIAGGLGGWHVGGEFASGLASSYAADAQADYAVAQQNLDSDRMVAAMQQDLEMEQEARDFARRMSAMAGVAQNTPGMNKAGYKWGGYLRG